MLFFVEPTITEKWNNVIKSVGKTELSNSVPVRLLHVEDFLPFVVRPLKKEVHEEFPRFAVVDNSPKHHCLVVK